MAVSRLKTDVVRGGEQSADQAELTSSVCGNMPNLMDNAAKIKPLNDHKNGVIKSRSGNYSDDAHSNRECNSRSDGELKLRLEWDAPYPKGAGLVNMGNTCFLNSTLQCLTYTPPLANYLLTGQHTQKCQINGFCMLCLLERHVISSLKGRVDIIKPLEILQSLKNICRHMTWGSQEDAHEFLRHVVDAMHKSHMAGCQAKSEKGKLASIVNRIFEGTLRSQVVCSICKTSSDTFDPFMDLSLDIKYAASINEALDKFFKSEHLFGENAYDCAKCRRSTSAEKCFAIRSVPTVLTLQLKRFDLGSKVRKHVEFTSRLEIKKYTTQKMGDSGDPLWYDLYAVLVHHGMSTNSGHYFAYIRAPNKQWYCMNDHMVTEVSFQRVQTAEAYVLFYCRRDKARVQQSNNLVYGPIKPSTNDVKVYGQENLLHNYNIQRHSNETKPSNGIASRLATSTKSGLQNMSSSSSQLKTTVTLNGTFNSVNHFSSGNSFAHREKVSFDMKPSLNGRHQYNNTDDKKPPLLMKIKNGKILLNTAKEQSSVTLKKPEQFTPLVPYGMDDSDTGDAMEQNSTENKTTLSSNVNHDNADNHTASVHTNTCSNDKADCIKNVHTCKSNTAMNSCDSDKSSDKLISVVCEQQNSCKKLLSDDANDAADHVTCSDSVLTDVIPNSVISGYSLSMECNVENIISTDSSELICDSECSDAINSGVSLPSASIESVTSTVNISDSNVASEQESNSFNTDFKFVGNTDKTIKLSEDISLPLPVSECQTSCDEPNCSGSNVSEPMEIANNLLVQCQANISCNIEESHSDASNTRYQNNTDKHESCNELASLPKVEISDMQIDQSSCSVNKEHSSNPTVLSNQSVCNANIDYSSNPTVQIDQSVCIANKEYSLSVTVQIDQSVCSANKEYSCSVTDEAAFNVGFKLSENLIDSEVEPSPLHNGFIGKLKACLPISRNYKQRHYRCRSRSESPSCKNDNKRSDRSRSKSVKRNERSKSRSKHKKRRHSSSDSDLSSNNRNKLRRSNSWDSDASSNDRHRSRHCNNNVSDSSSDVIYKKRRQHEHYSNQHRKNRYERKERNQHSDDFHKLGSRSQHSYKSHHYERSYSRHQLIESPRSSCGDGHRISTHSYHDSSRQADRHSPHRHYKNENMHYSYGSHHHNRIYSHERR